MIRLSPRTTKGLWSRVLGAVMVIGGLLAVARASAPPARSPEPPPGMVAPYRYAPSRGRVADAEVAFYKRRLRQHPNSGPDHALLAAAYLRQARATMEPAWYLLAEKEARASLSHQPFDNPGAVLALAQVAEARHDFSEAIAMARRTRVRGAVPPEALTIAANANLALGRVPEAADAARTLVKQAPSTGAYTALAQSLLAQGKDGEALDAFQQALLREEPGEQESSAWLRGLLARHHLRRGRLTLAEEVNRQALRARPEYPLALFLMGEIAARRGLWEEAERQYEAAYRQAPLPAYLMAQARARAARGDRAGAEALWARAEGMVREQMAKGASAHRRDLARLLLARGRPQEVEEALRYARGEALMRRDAETLDTLAWALFAAGKPAQARTILLEALRFGVRDARLRLRLSEVEARLGNSEAAARERTRAREIDPLEI